MHTFEKFFMPKFDKFSIKQRAWCLKNDKTVDIHIFGRDKSEYNTI